MATLMRSALKLRCNLCRFSQLQKITASPRFTQPSCLLFTSNKQKDSAITKKQEGTEVERLPENLLEKDENWMSYGYSFTDREEDEWSHHIIMFALFTMPIAWILLFGIYMPDYQDHSWTQREAFLELARREEAGLPHIDPNAVDPSKIILPTDEELGDFEIIV